MLPIQRRITSRRRRLRFLKRCNQRLDRRIRTQPRCRKRSPKIHRIPNIHRQPLRKASHQALEAAIMSCDDAGDRVETLTWLYGAELDAVANVEEGWEGVCD